MSLIKRMDVLKVFRVDFRFERRAILACLFLVPVWAGSLTSWAQERPTPYSVEDVESLLQGGVSTARVIDLVQQDCRDFLLNDTIERRLQEAGADEGTLDVLREACFIPPSTLALDTLGVIQPGSLPVPEPGIPENQNPIVHQFSDQYTRPGDVLTFNLRDLFDDSEHEWLTFGNPTSNNVRVATVNLSAEQLSVVPHEAGLALVAVSAFDDTGAEARLAFAVTVEELERRSNGGLRLALGGGVAALAGTVAFLVFRGGSPDEGIDPGNGVILPGHPGFPPAE